MAGLSINREFWHDRKVFVTGHTGFKGAWLSLWLQSLGADITGYSLPPETTPSLFKLLNLPNGHLADIRDTEQLCTALKDTEPSIVFHLAAQSLVRPSYNDPVGTFATNTVGTAAVLDAVRKTESVQAVIVVTSDKCYENREWPWPYRETDTLGGHDPYSASKGAAELVTSSMRRSFFAPYRASGHPARIATVRAGNVIGGGDWTLDRLVPDIVRATETRRVVIRNPSAVRPWQHVLEPIAAYLGLAERLTTDDADIDTAFNFGPDNLHTRSVLDVTNIISKMLGVDEVSSARQKDQPHEANLLTVDCSLSRQLLGWRPRLSFEQTIEMTAAWYKAHRSQNDMRQYSEQQIDYFDSISPYM